MQRLKITVAYNGANFEGWQTQACTHRAQPPTVQATLEQVFLRMTGAPRGVYGSGRTDSGVHAEGQVFHVDVPKSMQGIDWYKSLNALLPWDIKVLSVEQAPATFHARKDALRKTYAYTLYTGEGKPPPSIAPFCWGVHITHPQAMLQAAQLLSGMHDFASFQNSGTPMASTVRTIFSLEPVSHLLGGMLCPKEWGVCSWHVTGNGFLKQMVRNIMGLLVWAGQDKISVSDVNAILAAKSRAALPTPTAPAQGLSLLHVEYAHCQQAEPSAEE